MLNSKSGETWNAGKKSQEAIDEENLMHQLDVWYK